MLYSIEDYSVKQSAGALFGNEGRRLEHKIMEALCRQGVPSVLCDLTNTLRHGDVCVMVDADPFPIEVKSSANQNARTVRQAANLNALHLFLSEDKASNFRGVERVERRETRMIGTHVASFNDCLTQSRKNLWATARPDDGLTYLAFRQGADIERFRDEDMGEHISLLAWNGAIESEMWMPYFPFTLTVERAADLVALLEGRLVVIVAIDAHAIMRRFADLGLIATFVDDEQIAFKVRRPNASVDKGGAEVGVSFHFLRRTQFECEPIANLIKMAVDSLEYFEESEPVAPNECSEQDAQMMVAWRKLTPVLPPVLTDDQSLGDSEVQ